MSTALTIDQLQNSDQLRVIFGSKAAAYTLLFIEAYGSGYGSLIARTFDLPVNSVQQQLLKFEREGILVSTTVGKTRLFEFNPRDRTARNLQAFVAQELKELPDDVYRQYFSQRQRPRRTGKPLKLVQSERPKR